MLRMILRNRLFSTTTNILLSNHQIFQYNTILRQLFAVSLARNRIEVNLYSKKRMSNSFAFSCADQNNSDLHSNKEKKNVDRNQSYKDLAFSNEEVFLIKKYYRKKFIQEDTINESQLAVLKSIIQKLIDEPTNWRVLDLVHEDILKTLKYLKPPVIHQIINSYQKNLNYRVNFDEHKTLVKLSESYFKFMQSNRNSNQLTNELGYLFVLTTMVELIVIDRGQYIPDLIKQRDRLFEKYSKILSIRIDQVNKLLQKERSLPTNRLFKTQIFNEQSWLLLNDWFLKLIEENKASKYVADLFISSAQGAIYFNRLDVFEKLFKKTYDYYSQFSISDDIFYRTLKHGNTNKSGITRLFSKYLKFNPTIESVETLLRVWQLIGYTPNYNIMLEFKEYLQKLKPAKLRMKKMKFDLEGYSSSTKHQLAKNEFTQTQLNRMAHELKQNLFKNDIYKTINEEVFNTFDQFLDKNKFDIIVDGMNVYCNPFSPQNIYDNYNPRFNSLIAVIEQLVLANKMNILILFKSNISAYNRDDFALMNQDFPFVKTFFLDKIIQDDKFCIYAALRSNAKIVSNDRLWNNLISFNNEFYRWIRSRRIPFTKSQAILQFPPDYELTAQKVENTWYIPYGDDPRNSLDIKWTSIDMNDLESH